MRLLRGYGLPVMGDGGWVMGDGLRVTGDGQSNETDLRLKEKRSKRGHKHNL